MRHRRSGVKLNRTTSHRQAMFRNMVTSLFKHDRIKTTEAKAKELRRWADHIVTLAKRGDLHARRKAMSIVREKDVVHKVFEQASDRFGSVNGGYTRIIKIGRRPGDAAAMTLVELISSDEVKPAGQKKKTTPAVEAAPVPEPDKVESAPQADEIEALESEEPFVDDTEAVEAVSQDEIVEKDADVDPTTDEASEPADDSTDSKK